MKLNWFFRSILMNEAGDGTGGDGGGAVATADTGTAVVPAGDASAVTGTEDGAVNEGSGDTAALTTTGDRGARPGAHPALALLKDHADPEVKKYANTAQKAIAARQELGRLFPGQSPIAAVKALQGDMVSLAGRYYNTPDPRDPEHRTGIQQIKDKMAEFEEIDLLFYSGDPRILEGMTSDDEGKAAFAKLAPAMNHKWKEIAPKAYAAETARNFLGLMKEEWLTNERGEAVEQADVPHRIHRMIRALNPGKDASGAQLPVDILTLAAEVNALSQFVWRVQEAAKLAPEVFTKDATTAAKSDEREQKLALREQELREKDWMSARQIIANQAAGRLWKQLTKGYEISATDEEDAQALFHIRFDKSIQAKEPGAEERRRSYVSANDRDGYLAYEKYLMETYGLPALKMEITRMLARLAPAKPGQARPAASGAAAAKPAQAAPQGFTKLSRKPGNHELNYELSNKEMALSSRGVLRAGNSFNLKAGTRVCW